MMIRTNHLQQNSDQEIVNGVKQVANMEEGAQDVHPLFYHSGAS